MFTQQLSFCTCFQISSCVFYDTFLQSDFHLQSTEVLRNLNGVIYVSGLQATLREIPRINNTIMFSRLMAQTETQLSALVQKSAVFHVLLIVNNQMQPRFVNLVI